jgi:hypothetical protein
MAYSKEKLKAMAMHYHRYAVYLQFGNEFFYVLFNSALVFTVKNTPPPPDGGHHCRIFDIRVFAHVHLVAHAISLTSPTILTKGITNGGLSCCIALENTRKFTFLVLSGD